MKFTKPLSLAAIVVTTIFLSACQAPSHTLTFTPQAPTSTLNVSNQHAIVNVVTKDGRSQKEVSSYTKNGALFPLSAQPTVEALFQQVMQQNLNSKGFRLSEANSANTTVLVTVKDFYAKVEEGNLRHKISSKIQLEVHVQGAKGNFTKNMGASRTDEGALTVGNDDIQKSLSAALKDVVSAIYNDQEIGNAIRQYSN
ncbi:YajG family lipoprotein [Pasteurella bettyae]|uniref:Putative lipoprotein n=1 Tax=Pasteurella bettyae CCUG 2042 TaxID=1095749 RepID=I3DJ99_9PAST|nr:YajG family lipoprotein [Pasteurella bettyae]EIJ71792.1 putative lipoprotein [Pasteurella bettyae CCUG 2042]SUB22375.1 putative lipoprotein [Pasteurella bettyae]